MCIYLNPTVSYYGRLIQKLFLWVQHTFDFFLASIPSSCVSTWVDLFPVFKVPFGIILNISSPFLENNFAEYGILDEPVKECVSLVKLPLPTFLLCVC